MNTPSWDDEYLRSIGLKRLKRPWNCVEIEWMLRQARIAADEYGLAVPNVSNFQVFTSDGKLDDFETE